MTSRTLLPFDPEVVAPWRLGSGRRGVLLLHGFAGTPPELRPLGEHLANGGWRCYAPALSGHAATPADLAKTTWRDWLDSARAALDELHTTCDHVVVAGQSMGGTLALLLAATDGRVKAIATLAAPIWMHSNAKHFLRYITSIYKWHYPRSETDLYLPDGVEQLHSYGKRSTAAIAQFFQLLDYTADSVACIRPPVLVLHGLRDSVIDPQNAGDISARAISSTQVEKRLFPRSGHAMSVDVDGATINQAVLEWFDRFAPATPTGAPVPATRSATGHDMPQR